jgi:hypothetical protein
MVLTGNEADDFQINIISGKLQVPLLFATLTNNTLIPADKLSGTIMFWFIVTESAAEKFRAIADPWPGSVLKKYSALAICCDAVTRNTNENAIAEINRLIINNVLNLFIGLSWL